MLLVACTQGLGQCRLLQLTEVLCGGRVIFHFCLILICIQLIAWGYLKYYYIILSSEKDRAGNFMRERLLNLMFIGPCITVIVEE